jgi:hypothetical protein
LIIKSKEWLRINKKININDIDSIVSNNLYDSNIMQIYNFDFHKYYSDTLLSYGYVIDKNVIDILSSLFTKNFILKMFNDAIKIIDNHDMFLLKIINGDSNTFKNKDYILFLLASIYIPIHCKIILIFEILKTGNQEEIINDNTIIEPTLLKEKINILRSII